MTVSDVNETPLLPGAISVPETVPGLVVNLDATDAEDSEGAGLTYAFTGNGADEAHFNLDATTGAISWISAPDFEMPGDADTDNSYEIEVSVTDSGGLSTTQAVAITVTDLNEAPVLTDPGAISVPETVPGLVVTSTQPMPKTARARA